MKNRFGLLTLAAGVLLWGFATTDAKAGTVMVTEDGGSFNWSLHSDGAGHVTITFSAVQLTQINYTNLANHVDGTFATGNVLNITSTTESGPSPVWVFSMTSDNFKQFTDTGDVKLSYDIPGGSNAIAHGGFMDITGNVTGVVDNTLVHDGTTYDFSPFSSGVGHMDIQFNLTGAHIGTIVNGGGDLTGGTGAFTQSVPEPASLALLAIGMTGFLAFRRYFTKTSVS
jgi:PEP-CTERM motif